MCKLIYHVASTVDGFIAHLDNSIAGFITEGEVVTDYLASLRTDYDTVLMGRNTYEFGVRLGISSPYPWLRQYVFSRTLTTIPDPDITLVNDSAIDLVKALKQETGKNIYLCGGANLASSLFAANLIDEIVIKLNPVLFGSGISLFAGEIQPTNLELIDRKIYDSGAILLCYSLSGLRS